MSAQHQTASNHEAAFDRRDRRREELQPGQDLVAYVKAYASEKPEVAAMWCFGIGFIVGWKLKPW